jgi:hypothetical protein
VRENDREIEELSAPHPYRYPYYWNGKRWRTAIQTHKYDILWTALGMSPVFLFAILCLPKWYHALGFGMYLAILAVLLSIGMTVISLLLMSRD